jgi:PAS domain-containing protein
MVAALPQNTGATTQPFPTLSSPPAYHFVLLVMFAALLFTVALMTESLTSFLNRITSRLETTMRAREGTEDLYSEVLRVAPLPTVLVYSDTLRVARASESFLRHFFLKAGSLLDADLFSIAEFTHPEVVQALIAGTGGEISVAVYRVDGEPRAARVRVDPVTYDNRRYVYVTIQDMTDLQTLLTAFNAVDNAMMVLNQNQRLLYCNHAAEQMWGELSPGADVSAQLRKANLPDGWWQLGMRGRQERRLELNGRQFIAQCVAAKIPGERDALTVLSIRSAGRES